MRWTWLAVGSVVAGCVVARGPARVAPTLPIASVLVGDAGADSALLWVHAPVPGPVRVELEPIGNGDTRSAVAETTPDRDLTVKLDLRELAPRTRYRYRFGGDDAPWAGEFATAPRADDPAPVRFAFGGDVGGQDACRDVARGYAIFDEIARRTPDFFIGLGDMIYADNPCTARGRFANAQVPREVVVATDLDGFRAIWRYNRADEPFRRLMAQTSYVAVWDDHETVNDVGPLDDTREKDPYTQGVRLLPLGLRAFLEQNPLRESADTPGRLYRALRWGKHVELLALDTRQYRDTDRARDVADAPKTMLGREQRAWLERRLVESDATWKVIVSSVPIALPTGSARKGARDGWASHATPTGYERELASLFDAAAAAGVRNLLFVTTDVHFASVWRYRPVAKHPDFRVHEVVTGPLSAILGRMEAFDTSFGAERLFMHAAQKPFEVATLDEARRWFNFGMVEVDASGRLVVEVIDGYGAEVYALALDPE